MCGEIQEDIWRFLPNNVSTTNEHWNPFWNAYIRLGYVKVRRTPQKNHSWLELAVRAWNTLLFSDLVRGLVVTILFLTKIIHNINLKVFLNNYHILICCSQNLLWIIVFVSIKCIATQIQQISKYYDSFEKLRQPNVSLFVGWIGRSLRFCHQEFLIHGTFYCF